MPPLPNELFEKYTALGLSDYDASVLTDDKGFALYFEQLLQYVDNAKSAANWMMGEVKGHINELATTIDGFNMSPDRLAELINMVDSGKMGRTLAAQQLFPLMIKDQSKSAEQLAQENNLVQVGGEDELAGWIDQAMQAFPDKVEEYRGGKKGILGLFMGEVMRLSGGKADPKKTNQMLREKLDNE
ncbi:MAG: hypothetical protein Salg2KO_02530 [Salibacteraceae bacterium]